jgi:hypothetical protein
MMQRYYTVMSKYREIAVDLLNKMIINSRTLIKAKEKVSVEAAALARLKHLNICGNKNNNR